MRFEALAGEIEAIRDQIEKLKADWETIAPREARAQNRIGELGDLMNRQARADAATQRRANRRARRRAGAPEPAKTRDGNRASGTRTSQQPQRELEQGLGQIRVLEESLTAAREHGEAARARAAQGETNWQAAQEIALAWRAVFDVFEAQTRIKEGAAALEELERLGARVQECEAAFRALEKAPSLDELRDWRAAFDELTRLESEAVQGLQIEITPHDAATARWKADNGAIENLELEAGQKLNLLAIGRGVLDVARVAVFRFVTGARGIEEVKAELANARANLEKLLQAWKTDASELPAAIN